MAKVSLRVRAVEGHMVPDPWTLGAPQLRMIGHDRKVDPNTQVMSRGYLVPNVTHEINEDDVVIAETTDQYLRKQILDGSLEYVETLFDWDPAKEQAASKKRDPELVRATALAKRARDAAKKAAEQADAEANAAEKLALEAAEQGLTVDEVREREAAKEAEKAREAEKAKAPVAEIRKPSPAPADPTA